MPNRTTRRGSGAAGGRAGAQRGQEALVQPRTDAVAVRRAQVRQQRAPQRRPARRWSAGSGCGPAARTARQQVAHRRPRPAASRCGRPGTGRTGRPGAAPAAAGAPASPSPQEAGAGARSPAAPASVGSSCIRRQVSGSLSSAGCAGTASRPSTCPVGAPHEARRQFDPGGGADAAVRRPAPSSATRPCRCSAPGRPLPPAAAAGWRRSQSKTASASSSARLPCRTSRPGVTAGGEPGEGSEVMAWAGITAIIGHRWLTARSYADRRTRFRATATSSRRRRWVHSLPPPRPARRGPHGRHPHHRHRSRHQLVARALALARRHHRLRRGARAGRGVCADGVLPRVAVRRGDDAGRAPARPGWPGTPARPTRPASRSARPARATPSARAAAAASTKCSTGPNTARPKSAPSGAASRWRARPGASTATPSARARPRRRPPATRRSSAARRRVARDAPAASTCEPASRHSARPHRAAGLAGVRRPARGAGLRHGRHRAGGARHAPPTWRHWRSAARPTSRSSSA